MPGHEGVPAMGLVILEGPDGAGKTTLANDLANYWGAYLPQTKMIRGSDRHWDHDRYRGALHDAMRVNEAGGVAIMDRCWWSNEVYGCFDRTPETDTVNVDFLDAELDEAFRWWMLVLCLPSRSYESVQHETERANLRDVRSTYCDLLLGCWDGNDGRTRQNGFITSFDFKTQHWRHLVALLGAYRMDLALER